jgi:hypothetical protein
MRMGSGLDSRGLTSQTKASFECKGHHASGAGGSESTSRAERLRLLPVVGWSIAFFVGVAFAQEFPFLRTAEIALALEVVDA